MRVSNYINFPGNCAEAMNFYKDLLHADSLYMMTWGESPMKDHYPAALHGTIMHASLNVGQDSLMASDASPEQYKAPRGIGLALEVDSNEEAERIFAALSEGGKTTMAMSETFWAYRFGMVTDRFDVPWMINHSKPMSNS